MASQAGPELGNRDERLGEAVEAFLERAESGHAPDLDAFVDGYPDLGVELREALDGLALVQGLVGSGSGHGGIGPRHLEAGYRVAGYRIVRELGRGGMGVVYEAVHLDLDRPVALKILGGHAAPGSDGRRRFLNEAKTAAGLHHTYIVPVFDVGQVGGLCYYAMQRIEGAGLDRVVRALRHDRSTASGGPSAGRTPNSPRVSNPAPTGLLSAPSVGDSTATWPRFGGHHGRSEDRPPPFTPPVGSSYYRWVAGVGRQAAEALAYAHHCGVIHRDIKPSNLLVDAGGTVWVADFGLARRLEDPGQTRGDGPLGTPRYMSPEQAEGGSIDGRTDVYSLGATLYELLTLRPPFDGQTTAELIRQISEREPLSPRRFTRRLPRDLETIVLKAMARRPSDRYENAGALADDLDRFLNLEAVRARRISPLGRGWRLARRHPAASAITAAAALAVVAVATVAYVRVANERDRAVVLQGKLEDALTEQRAATRTVQRAREELTVALERQRAATLAELLGQVSLMRTMPVTNRRDKGRAKLRDASALRPDAAMRLRLRDEAVELLANRDVEELPSLPTGAVRGLAPLPSDDPGSLDALAVLDDDGGAVTVWNVEDSRPGPSLRLAPEPSPVEPPDEASERSGRSRRSGPAIGPLLASVGGRLVAPAPGGIGVALLDPETGRSETARLDGAEVLGVLGSPSSDRLVTIEAIPREDRRPDDSADRGRPVDDDDGEGRRPRATPPGYRVRLWGLEAQALKVIATLAELPNPATRRSFLSGVPLVALDPEGRTAAIGQGDEPKVDVFDLKDGAHLFGFDPLMGLKALTAGPAGLLATADDSRVQLWEIDPWSGREALPLPGLTESPGFVRTLRFSPGGRLLAAAGFNSGVELWDPAAGALVASLPSEGWMDDLAFADDRTLLIASGASTQAWSIAEPIGRVRFDAPNDAPNRTPVFSPDGSMVLPRFDDQPRLWHPDECPTRSRAWEAPEAASAAIAQGPGGAVLAFGPVGLARFGWADAPEPMDRLPWPIPPGLRGEAPTAEPPSGRVRLLTATPDHRAALLERELLEPSATTGIGDATRGRGPRKQYLLWRADPEGGGPGRFVAIPPEVPLHGSRGRPPQAALAPDGQRLELFDDQGDLSAWRLDGDRAEPIAMPETGRAWSLELSPDGHLLALGGNQGEVRFLSTETYDEIGRIPPRAETSGEGAGALGFSPDGRTLAVGDYGGTLDLWSIAGLGAEGQGPRRLLRLSHRRDPILSAAFSPDGRHLVAVLARTFEEHVVEVWDMAALTDELDSLGLGWDASGPSSE